MALRGHPFLTMLALERAEAVALSIGLHPSGEHASVYTEGELRHLSEEQQLIHKVFDFSDAEVKEAMVPRPQITALPVTADLDDVRRAFLTGGYSRLPVYGKDLDDMIACCMRAIGSRTPRACSASSELRNDESAASDLFRASETELFFASSFAPLRLCVRITVRRS